MSRFRRLPPSSMLTTFEAAARLESFKKAANELNVTPSAVSHQIKQLEEMLSVTLFEREVSGNLLTSEGELFASKIRQAFVSIEEGTADVCEPDSFETLSLLVPAEFGHVVLGSVFDAFYEAFPHIRVDVRYVNEQQTQQGINFDDTDYDGAILWGNGVWTQMEVVPLYQTKIGVWGAKQYFKEIAPIIDCRDLQNYPWVVSKRYPMQWRWWTQCVGQSQLSTSQGEIWIDERNEYVEALMSKPSLGIGETLFTTLSVNSSDLIPVCNEFVPAYRYCFVYPQKREPRPSLLRLVEWLKSYAKTHWSNISISK